VAVWSLVVVVPAVPDDPVVPDVVVVFVAAALGAAALPLCVPLAVPVPSHAIAAPAPERASAPVTAAATSGRAVLTIM